MSARRAERPCPVAPSGCASSRRSIDLLARSFFVAGRPRVVVRIDGDRLRSGGRQLECIRLSGLLIAPPDRRPCLGLDLLDEASRDQLRRDLMRRAALQLLRRRKTAIVALRSGAQHDELRVRKFDGHRSTLLCDEAQPIWAPSLTRARIGAAVGAKDPPRKINPPQTSTLMLSFEGNASLFCAFGQPAERSAASRGEGSSGFDPQAGHPGGRPCSRAISRRCTPWRTGIRCKEPTLLKLRQRTGGRRDAGDALRPTWRLRRHCGGLR